MQLDLPIASSIRFSIVAGALIHLARNRGVNVECCLAVTARLLAVF